MGPHEDMKLVSCSNLQSVAMELCVNRFRQQAGEAPGKKQAFVKTVYASGSPRLFKNKTVEAGEKRPEMLLTVRLVDCWLA